MIPSYMVRHFARNGLNVSDQPIFSKWGADEVLGGDGGTPGADDSRGVHCLLRGLPISFIVVVSCIILGMSSSLVPLMYQVDLLYNIVANIHLF